MIERVGKSVGVAMLFGVLAAGVAGYGGDGAAADTSSGGSGGGGTG